MFPAFCSASKLPRLLRSAPSNHGNSYGAPHSQVPFEHSPHRFFLPLQKLPQGIKSESYVPSVRPALYRQKLHNILTDLSGLMYYAHERYLSLPHESGALYPGKSEEKRKMTMAETAFSRKTGCPVPDSSGCKKPHDVHALPEDVFHWLRRYLLRQEFYNNCEQSKHSAFCPYAVPS